MNGGGHQDDDPAPTPLGVVVLLKGPQVFQLSVKGVQQELAPIFTRHYDGLHNGRALGFLALTAVTASKASSQGLP